MSWLLNLKDVVIGWWKKRLVQSGMDEIFGLGCRQGAVGREKSRSSTT
jgi:hypothetical protein